MIVFDRETCRNIARTAVVAADRGRRIARVPAYWFADLDFPVITEFHVPPDALDVTAWLAAQIETAVMVAQAEDAERRARNSAARARDAEIERINSRDGTRLRRHRRAYPVL